jgi:hypothetical protein
VGLQVASLSFDAFPSGFLRPGTAAFRAATGMSRPSAAQALLEAFKSHQG